jgi:photosystem II stability/assembly factor-like uncharacterized protein
MSRSSFGFRALQTLVLSVVIVVAFAPAASARKPTAPPEQEAGWDDRVFAGLEWRLVGPYRGGRSAAVAGLASQPNVYYFGGTGGGVWKTTDAGSSWENVSDEFFGGSIGAVAVSEWDPNVVYVGGGEKTVRGNVSHGDGIWKSTDAGKTWSFSGLEDSRHVPRIRIHPRDPDLVYAAVLGHLFGPNEERGVYRSKDGGASWERVLFVNASAGAVDLAMDPTNPRVLYASMWRVLRTPYSLESGGEGSSLWKSTDGGDSWTELTGNEGLPEGTWGISGITVSPSNPLNLYAIVEAEKGGVFRSTDAGETWAQVNDERKLRQRAWYYTRIYADPADEDSVYVLNVRFHRSKDGGKTFEAIGVPHGDNHDLWIAPDDPLRMVQSNDGGANVSFDGGETWSVQTNQPTAQFYRVSTDNDFPYRLLGGQQDNSAVRIRSRSAFGSSIGLRDWEPTAGGESGHIVAHPEEPDIVYGGSYDGFLIRVDHRTGERRSVDVWPDNPMGWGAAELAYRFQWNFPIFFSPHDANVLYAAGNVLFKTTDEGASWEAISPDLTRNDKSTQGSSGGPITKDNTSVEYYGTIFAAAESPLQAGVLWAGSDDGLIHLSRDGGENWEDVTPPGLPEWTMINSIEPHPTSAAGLYVAGTRYKLDDFSPYLYKTTDWGKSWERIDSGIAEDHFTRVIRADPGRAGLLYAGTERGVYASFDDGASWRSLQRNLPVVPITDLAVKEDDLVAATQGRSFWILDGLSPLHELSDAVAEAPFHLFPPAAAWRLRGGRSFRTPRFQGENPPSGAVVDFLLDDVPEETKVALEFTDAAGEVIRRFEGEVDFEKDEEAGEAEGDEEAAQPENAGEENGEAADSTEAEESAEPGDEERDPSVGELELERGLNRFAWDLRAADAEEFEGIILWAGDTEGPVVPPGAYTVTLTVGDESVSAGFELLKDPRSSASQAELEEQYAFQIGIRDKLSEIHGAIKDVRKVRAQLGELEARLGDGDGATEIRESAKALEEAMSEVEKALYQTKNQSRQDPLNFPIRLNDKLGGVASLVSIGDAAPTSQSYAVRDELLAAIDAELAKLEALWTEDLPALNEKVRAAAVPALSVEGD